MGRQNTEFPMTYKARPTSVSFEFMSNIQFKLGLGLGEARRRPAAQCNAQQATENNHK